MTLPLSGSMSIAQINTEFGRGNNLNAYRGTIWYTDSGQQGVFSIGSPISLGDFYGKRPTAPSGGGGSGGGNVGGGSNQMN
jgi:hypothetical protein